jgi:hypothetical protein
MPFAYAKTAIEITEPHALNNDFEIFPSPSIPLPEGEGRVVVLRTLIDGEG